VSTSDIIAAISTAIAAVSLGLSFAQYRRSRIRNRTETNRRVGQYQHLNDLAARAASQAETAKMLADRAVRGIPVNSEDLRMLSEASGKLSAELSTEAECARPAPSRRRYRYFRR
jgi:alkylation response protein AidB-like acyl-CoA dehydrogenase